MTTQRYGPHDFTDGSAHVLLATLLAGEPGSGKLLETSAPANMTLINGTSAVEINDGQAGTTRLGKIMIAKALVGTLTIGGFQDQANAAQNIVFPIGASPGLYDFHDALADKGALTATLSSTSDNNLVGIIWSEAS